MAYSELNIHPHGDSNFLDLEAVGGTRRQRGAVIAAYIRKHRGLTLVHVSYSETYGFQTATYARYRVDPS